MSAFPPPSGFAVPEWDCMGLNVFVTTTDDWSICHEVGPLGMLHLQWGNSDQTLSLTIPPPPKGPPS